MSRPSNRLALSCLIAPRSIATFATLVAVAAGCQMNHKPAPTPAPAPMSAEAYDSVRSQLMAGDANAKVTQVTEVLPGNDATSLRFSGSAADFPVGAIVTIVDADANPIANATVFASKDDAVDANYVVVSGQRRPIRGDAIVKFADQPAMPMGGSMSTSQPTTQKAW